MAGTTIKIAIFSSQNIAKMTDIEHVKSLYFDANRQARLLDIYIETLLRRRLELMEKEESQRED